jgi:biopolymer transport protein ExbD
MASKKLRSAQSRDEEELEINMSPMIDMVFLLLIFFIVNASLIVVKMDKRVTVPIAKHSEPQKSKLGRIVINVYNDEKTADPEKPGRYKDENGKLVFADDAAMVDYIEKARQRWEQAGIKPRIHLRGDENVQFTYVRRVIRNAARAGVIEVIFVSYPYRQEG